MKHVLWVVVLLMAVVAVGATVGDGQPIAVGGTTCVLMDDGGTNVATPIWVEDGGTAAKLLKGRNTTSVQNSASSSGTIYCGWTRGTTSTNAAYEVTAGSLLSIDVTCPNPPNCPILYCVTGTATVNQTTPNCTRWSQVK